MNNQLHKIETAQSIDHNGKHFEKGQTIWFLNKDLEETVEGTIETLFPSDNSADIWNDYLGFKCLFLDELYLTESDATAALMHEPE